MAEKENPENSDVGFYAIIPATVRYDKTIPQGAKLLYGEISALVKKRGYCWAQNEYFSKLYETSERTIIEWIGRLRDAGHIDVYLEYFPDSKKIKCRRIALPLISGQKLPAELARSRLVVKKTSPPEELVVKKTSPPSSEENSFEIYTNLNNTSSSSKFPEEKEPLQKDFKSSKTDPPLKTPSQAFSQADIFGLKDQFKQISNSLVFSEAFYSEALSFLAVHGLDYGYINWIYEFCMQKKPKSIENYLFKVFFDVRCVELYREASQSPSLTPVSIVVCPVCEKECSSGDSLCPHCDFDLKYPCTSEEIDRKKRLYAMSPETKRSYEEEFDNLLITFKKERFSDNFKEKQHQLNTKYGVL